MNPNSPRTPREDLEIRLVAMLLGELSAPEADALRQELARDPELAQFYNQLQETIPLIREATATKPTADAVPAAQLRLTSPRRETLLGVLKTVPLPTVELSRRRDTAWILPMSLAACLVAMLALLGLGPMFVKAKTKGLSHLPAMQLKTMDTVGDGASSAPVNEYALQQGLEEREHLSQEANSVAKRALETVSAPEEGRQEVALARRYGLRAPAPTAAGASETSSLRRSARSDPAPVNGPAATPEASQRGLTREKLDFVAEGQTPTPTTGVQVEELVRKDPAASAAPAVRLAAPARPQATPQFVPPPAPPQLVPATPAPAPDAPPAGPASAAPKMAGKPNSTWGDFDSDGKLGLAVTSGAARQSDFGTTSNFRSLASGTVKDSESMKVVALRDSVRADSATEIKFFSAQQVAASDVEKKEVEDLASRLGEAEISFGKELAKTPTSAGRPVLARRERSAGRTGGASDGASPQESLARSGGLEGFGGGGAAGGVVNGRSVPLDVYYAETDQAARGGNQINRWHFESAPRGLGVQPAAVPEVADADFLGRQTWEVPPTDAGLGAAHDSSGANWARFTAGSAAKPETRTASQPEQPQLRAMFDDNSVAAGLPLERYSRGSAVIATAGDFVAADKKVADLAQKEKAAKSSSVLATIVLPSAEGLVPGAPEPAIALGFEPKSRAEGLVVETRGELRAKDRMLTEALAGEPVLATNQVALKDQPLARLRPGAPEPQPEISAHDNAFSTFSLNVSDVSFKLAEASLQNGALPEPATVRTEEFLNALDYRDPEPPAGMPIAFAWERARYPFAHNRDILRLSVKTAARGREPGRPLNLVLLLDSSGSMERADRVLIIGECLRILAGQLTPQDKISVVTFARTAQLRMDGINGAQAAEAVEQMRELTPEGGTNLEDALNLAYATARRHFLSGGVNRVVLLTDGAANLGNVDPATLKRRVEEQRRQGIALDSFGIGWEGFADDLLEVLTRNGDGRYGFINSPEEAAAGFAGQLAGALQVAASDVKVQIEFNPRRVTAYRQLGYAKHQLKKEQFRDNTVDAAEIGAAESGNALYVLEVNPRGQGDLAVARVRFKVPGTDDYREHEWTVPYLGASAPLDQSTPSLRLAAVAGAFAEWLVSSPFAGEVTPDALLSLLRGVPAQFGADTRPQRLEAMIRQAKSISGQ